MISKLSKLLVEKKVTISLAESCTGGMISSDIVSIPGSSKYFMGSAVVYSNDAKESILDVKHETLMKHGAVSKETAEEMAIGSLKKYSSIVAASVTGIAGPEGGSPEKPVGTVWMAVTNGKNTITKKNVFQGERNEIRRKSADSLIELICHFIEDEI